MIAVVVVVVAKPVGAAASVVADFAMDVVAVAAVVIPTNVVTVDAVAADDAVDIGHGVHPSSV